MTNFTQRRKFSTSDAMHKAVCADCGKSCDVPFKPNGKKPVYCKDCFAKNGGQVTTNHFSTNPRREAPPSYAARPRPSYGDNRGSDDTARQLEALNAKLDNLLRIVGDLAQRGK